MDVGKTRCRKDVIDGDRQKRHTKILNSPEGLWDRVFCSYKPATPNLIQHLPNGGITDEQLICRIFQQFAHAN